jgi:uncharacterized protein involved in exopolysaccharide biosynthesis
MALLTGAAVVAWGLAQPRSWRTEVSFRPQGNESSTGRLSSLAAQFGVSVPAGAREDSPEFYVELVRSRAFMTRLADTPLPDAEDGTVSLPELVGIEGGSPEEVEERTVRWLQERAVSASTGMETGVVRVAVTTEWPAVSAALAEAVIAEVNRFNSAVRRSQASAEREFVGKQLKSARGELQAAEDSLRRFLEANRQFQNSPQLRFEHDRLQRDVDMRQQLFASLNEAFQQARISEVRNTPVINVLQEPYIAALPQGRELFLKLLLGLVAGGGLGLLIGLLRHNGTPDRAADRAAWEEVRGFVEDVRQRRWRRVLFGG